MVSRASAAAQQHHFEPVFSVAGAFEHLFDMSKKAATRKQERQYVRYLRCASTLRILFRSGPIVVGTAGSGFESAILLLMQNV